MKDNFEQRKKGMEAKLHHDGEMRFKIQSRTDKLLGLWIAEQLGMTDAQAQEYAKTVAVSDIDEPGREDVLRKVLDDLNNHSLTVTRDMLDQQLQRLEPIARQQVLEED